MKDGFQKENGACQMWQNKFRYSEINHIQIAFEVTSLVKKQDAMGKKVSFMVQHPCQNYTIY